MGGSHAKGRTEDTARTRKPPRRGRPVREAARNAARRMEAMEEVTGEDAEAPGAVRLSLPGLRIGQSQGRGKGVFASRRLPANTVVAVVRGTRVTQSVREKLEDYMVTVPMVHGTTLLALDPEGDDHVCAHINEANPGESVNCLIYAHRSVDAMASAGRTWQERTIVCFVTVRAVEASRELLTHYGEEYAPVRERKQYTVTDETFPDVNAADVDLALRRFAEAQHRTVRDIAYLLGRQERALGPGGAGRTPEVPSTPAWRRVLSGLGPPAPVWPDGSCWLWAVARAMGRLTGGAVPSAADLALESRWRRQVADEMLVFAGGVWAGHQLEERERLRLEREASEVRAQRVVYEGGRVARPGSWGGHDHFRAMSVCLEVTIANWHVMGDGRGATVYTPDGRMEVMSVRDLDAYVASKEGNTVVHLLWNGRDHYDTFQRPMQTEPRWGEEEDESTPPCQADETRHDEVVDLVDAVEGAGRRGEPALCADWVEELDVLSDSDGEPCDTKELRSGAAGPGDGAGRADGHGGELGEETACAQSDDVVSAAGEVTQASVLLGGSRMLRMWRHSAFCIVF